MLEKHVYRSLVRNDQVLADKEIEAGQKNKVCNREWKCRGRGSQAHSVLGQSSLLVSNNPDAPQLIRASLDGDCTRSEKQAWFIPMILSGEASSPGSAKKYGGCELNVTLSDKLESPRLFEDHKCLGLVVYRVIRRPPGYQQQAHRAFGSCPPPSSDML